MAVQSTFYADALFFDALRREIGAAAFAVDVATFVFKTSYTSYSRAHEIADALKAAAARGVVVRVALNFCGSEPDVCVENYETALDLAAGGCRVRLGPVRQTLHSKVAVADSLVGATSDS